MKNKKFIYKKLGPILGSFLDKLFFTEFASRSSNYYHQYNQNDYSFNKKDYCFVHVPRTGGWSFRNYFEEHNLPFYVNEMKGHHNPVSLLCPPKDYKYVTIIRDPIQRVRSHYQMFQQANNQIASRGLINFLRYCSEVKNLYCQYYSGLIGESVDETIYQLALKNLKDFKFIVNYKNYDEDLKNFLKKFQIQETTKKFFNNKSNKIEISREEKDAISAYNYWDIKLFEEIKNKSLTNYI